MLFLIAIIYLRTLREAHLVVLDNRDAKAEHGVTILVAALHVDNDHDGVVAELLVTFRLNELQ